MAASSVGRLPSRLNAKLFKAAGVPQEQVNPRSLNTHVLLRCAPGLESLLSREISALEDMTTARIAERHGAVHAEFEDPSTYLRIILKSRLMERCLLCLGPPQREVETMGRFFQLSMNMPWGKYLPLSSKMDLPGFRVTAKGSILGTMSDKVKSQLAAVLTSHRKAAVENKGDTPFEVKTIAKETEQQLTDIYCPTVHVDFWNNHCSARRGGCTTACSKMFYSPAQIAVDASGLVGIRRWKCPADKERLIAPCRMEIPLSNEVRIATKTETSVRLTDSECAAVALRTSLLKELSRAGQQGKKLVVWDPFCGNFGFLLEATGIVLGVPPNRRDCRLPLINFPCLDWLAFKELRREITLGRHPHWESLRLVGSDVIAHDAEKSFAGQNRKNFLNHLALETKDDPTVVAKIKERLVLLPEATFPENLVQRIRPEDCLLLTALPVKKQTRDKGLLMKFAKFLHNHKFRGVYVVVPENTPFRERSGLPWTVKLKFGGSSSLGGGPNMELLELMPDAANYEPNG